MCTFSYLFLVDSYLNRLLDTSVKDSCERSENLSVQAFQRLKYFWKKKRSDLVSVCFKRTIPLNEISLNSAQTNRQRGKQAEQRKH